MKLKSLVRVGAFVTCLAVTSSLVFAATIPDRKIANYNLFIPRLGGNAYTEPLLKVSTESGVNRNTSTGASKTVYSTICKGTSNVTGEIKTTSGSRVIIPYNQGQNIKDLNYRLMMETSLFETVTVQAQGSWSPDLAP